MLTKIALFASAAALVVTQPAVAASAQPAGGDMSSNSMAGPSPSDHRSRLTPSTIAVSLAALSAAVLGIVAATSYRHDHEHRPTSP